MPVAKQSPRIAVIGGGPAGLMAAGTAASQGARVILFEKKPSCGIKLLITGSGRCNVTNHAPWDEFLANYPENSKFLYPAFKTFFIDDLKVFFHQYGLELTLEENGKYFPETQQARSVLDVLLAYCVKNRVSFHTAEPVRMISHSENQWAVQTENGCYQADAVILATGGLSYPRTGSEGDGYRLAANLSHTVIATRPALVPVEIRNLDCSALSGVSLPDVRVRLAMSDLVADTVPAVRGGLLFTHFGVSGPVILKISRWLPSDVDFPQNADRYSLAIDLLPLLSTSEIERMLLQSLAQSPKRQLKNLLSHIFDLPAALSAKIITCCQWPDDILSQQVTRDYRKKLIAVLKSFNLTIRKTRGYQEAMVTAGGLSTREINPRTMESKLHPGLYFAGEIIDIDGFTGGFNLQSAFSTGYLAGKSAASQSRLLFSNNRIIIN
jgi:predicted Rossmann fold flavoprotein